MRTKALLVAAIFAAGLATSMAQNVYSLNVVGYVNIQIPANGYALIANPMDSTDNSVSNLFSQATESLGDTVYTWDGTGFVGNFNDDLGGGWADPAQDLSPGKGFFVKNVGDAYTLTCVGEVMQGALVNNPPAGYGLLSSMVPQAGYVGDLGLNAGLGDYIYLWDGSGFVGSFNDDLGGGWSPAGSVDVDPVKGPKVEVGQSFFYRNVAGTATWERNFTVQ